MTQREAAIRSLIGPCKEVYSPRGVPANRQGWRQRLAFVECHLATAYDGRKGQAEHIDAMVGIALSEIRSMLDGE
jgi:hypothetical protein